MRLLVVALLVGAACATTYIKASRPVDTCDADDFAVKGTTKFLYAYGHDDPSHLENLDIFGGGTIHGGALVTPQMSPYDGPTVDPYVEDDTQTCDITSQGEANTIPYGNRVMTEESTIWISMGFDLYNLIDEADDENAVHITKWEIIIEEGHDEYVHHMNFQTCWNGLSGFVNEPATQQDYDEFTDPGQWGESFIGTQTARSIGDCWLIAPALFTYVIAAFPQSFNKEAGVRVGGNRCGGTSYKNPGTGNDFYGPFTSEFCENPGGLRFIVMEMHYDIPWYNKPESEADNPDWVPDHLFEDWSGVRVYYTQQLRKYDQGQQWIGVDYGETFVLPAMQPRYLSRGMNHPHCTESTWPHEDKLIDGGVRIDQLNLHMHDQGREMISRQIRCKPGEAMVNGAIMTGKDCYELPPIAADYTYNNYYQQYFKVDAIWKEHDYHVIDCYSSTEDYHHATYGNLATDEQMCLIIFTFYPTLYPFVPPMLSQDQTDIQDDQYYSRWCERPMAVRYGYDDNGDGVTDYKNEDATEVAPNGPHSVDMHGPTARAANTWVLPPFVPYEAPDPCAHPHDVAHPAVKQGVEPELLQNFKREDYENHQFLDPEGKFELLWTMDMESQMLHYAAIVDTDGWIAFGISATNEHYTGKEDFHYETGQGGQTVAQFPIKIADTDGADLLVGWVDGKGVHVHDAWSDKNGHAHVDKHQDYFNKQGREEKSMKGGGMDHQDKYNAPTVPDYLKVGGGVAAVVAAIAIIAYVVKRRRKRQDFAKIRTERSEVVIEAKTDTQMKTSV